MDLSGKVAWVVGGSSGIGAWVARELQSRGALVAISARRQDQLGEVAAGSMLAVAADVTDAASLLAAASRIRDELGPIDLAVLSAGYWKQTTVKDWDTETFNRHVQVNLIGMSNAIAAVLPQMLARRSGVIAGISSVAGYRGLAGSEAYGATKAGQINLLEGLRIGAARDGVRIVTICPGFVRTDLTAGNSFPMPFLIDADTAGRAICDGLERERNEIVFPLRMAVLMKIARLLPVSLWSTLWSRLSPPLTTREPKAPQKAGPEKAAPEKTARETAQKEGQS
jgi:NAD(P)-dependent dehydrogenase (short-subunit alcohol dehydrogenase family)